MKIGIRYCGGCNPKYNRENLVSRFKNDFSETYEITTAEPGKQYAFLLVVGGCSHCCADYSPYHVLGEVLFLKNSTDYDTVAEHLRCKPFQKE